MYYHTHTHTYTHTHTHTHYKGEEEDNLCRFLHIKNGAQEKELESQTWMITVYC